MCITASSALAFTSALKISVVSNPKRQGGKCVLIQFHGFTV